MKKKSNIPWIITLLLAIVLVVLSFTPLVIPYHTYHPQVAGIPYSLWVSILVSIMMIILTYIATRVHPGNRQKKTKNNKKPPTA